MSFVKSQKLMLYLGDNPTTEISISGHTDNVGNDEANQILSANRAKAVVDYLVSKTILASRLQQLGYGETRSLATNHTNKGKALNSKIEFTINKN